MPAIIAIMLVAVLAMTGVVTLTHNGKPIFTDKQEQSSEGRTE